MIETNPESPFYRPEHEEIVKALNEKAKAAEGPKNGTPRSQIQ